MTWTWRLEAADGMPAAAGTAPAQSSQADAESWLGEQWRELRASGVAQVTLLHGDAEVYGPMSLDEA